MTISGQFVPLRAACVVPAYNAAETLEQVIDGVRQTVPRVRVVVIDDGSTDETREVADRVADDVVGFDHNRGKGAALRAGFEAALAERCSTVMTIDADGQHDPAFAPALFSALTRVDVVIGVRKRNGSGMPFYRRLCRGERVHRAAVYRQPVGVPSRAGRGTPADRACRRPV
jgi:glycosyltransferase involved in cell wall biosynthesis